MKYLLIILVCFSCCGKKVTKTSNGETASTASPVAETTAPVVIDKKDSSVIGNPNTPTVSPVNTGSQVALRFGSIASGPIGDDFLKNWLEKFNRDEKAGITADKFSACGKEGEYIIIIHKNNFSRATEDKFTGGLEKLVAAELKRTRAESSSSGSVEIVNDPKVEEYSYCRLGSKKWL